MQVRLELADEMDLKLAELKEQYMDERDASALRELQHVNDKIELTVLTLKGRHLLGFSFDFI